jgi:diguanylate cyclase (GGDEF)-like protein/PAS domain S-box-containing protein
MPQSVPIGPTSEGATLRRAARRLALAVALLVSIGAPVLALCGAMLAGLNTRPLLDAPLPTLSVIALFSALTGTAIYYTVRRLALRAIAHALQHMVSAHRDTASTLAALSEHNCALVAQEQALRATETALAHRSAQLREAHRLSQIGDWRYHIGDTEMWCSDELKQLLGYDPDRFVATRTAVMSLHVDDSARRVLTSQAEVMRTGAIHCVDVKLRRGDGSIGDFAVTSKALIDSEGRTTGFSGTIQDITARKSAEAQLAQLAFFDPLTGLVNRTSFNHQTTELLRRSRRSGQPAALLLFDLDGFKTINATLGHAAADELLIKAAARISGTAGAKAIVSRLDGDEFAVLLGEASRQEAELVAHAIISTIAAPIELERGEAYMTTSIGIATMPRDGITFNDLLRAADLARHHAREAGRGGFKVFEPFMSAAVQQQLALSHDLQQALEHGAGLQVLYQPQLVLATQRVTGYEALPCWTHPSAGIVPPEQLVTIAESGRLLGELTLWLLRTAALQGKAWIERGEPRAIAVRIQPAQMLRSDFPGALAQILDRTGLPPPMLCLELAQTLLTDYQAERIEALFSQLKRLGVGLRLNGFGAGSYSIRHLGQLPLDGLTIDRQLLHNVEQSERARQALQGIIALGHSLDLAVLVQGVEHVAQADVLAELGCDIAQGPYFAAPLAAADAIRVACRRDAQELRGEDQPHPDEARRSRSG